MKIFIKIIFVLSALMASGYIFFDQLNLKTTLLKTPGVSAPPIKRETLQTTIPADVQVLFLTPKPSLNLNTKTTLSNNAEETTTILNTKDPDEISDSNLELYMSGQKELRQDHPRLIQEIKDKYLIPPSKNPYNLKQPDLDPSKGQSKAIKKLLNDQVGGFFIECGALDGETRSNTLFFEKDRQWNGVLIEGDPSNVKLMLPKNRRAWIVSACLSTKPYPNQVLFRQQFNIGKISETQGGVARPGLAKVQCLPVYSILLALNRTSVDYFSLDVEGFELDVLRTVPWDKVNIRTLSVEFVHGPEGKNSLRKFMEDLGYIVDREVTSPGGLANDFIFTKSSNETVAEHS